MHSSSNECSVSKEGLKDMGNFWKKHILKLPLILVFVFSHDIYFNFQMTLRGPWTFYFYEREAGICWHNVFFSLILTWIDFSEGLFVTLMLMKVMAAANLSWNSLQARHYCKQLRFRYFTLIAHIWNRWC